MLTKERDERYGTVSIQEETEESGLKMLGVNTVIYITMSSVEKVSRKLSFTVTQETGGTQVMRHKEDKRKYFFTQPTTGCC